MARTLNARGHSPLQRPAGVALLLVVTLAHLWLSDELMEDRLGFGAGSQAMRRIEVAYVRELALAPPAAEAPAPPPPRAKPRARRAVAKAPPASAPQAPETPPVVTQAEAAPLPEPPALLPPVEPAPPLAAAPELPSAAASEPALAAAPESAASAPAVAAAALPASTASAVPFEWPPSTRLTYGLNGNYRGEVQGSATVEWIRVGLRYQVHMEAVVGPTFAPLLVRRVSSEGDLGDSGLSPQRFQGEQRVAFRSRRWAMSFEPERVRLPGGNDVPTVPGVQDEASMFVQLTWLFTTQPQQLQVGRTIEMPLALPRRVEMWQYDVIGEEMLPMPFATEVPTLHVKPRRLAKPGGDMTAEMWFAPGFQYLPVRILIHQDAQTFVDLTLQRPPQQAR